MSRPNRAFRNTYSFVPPEERAPSPGFVYLIGAGPGDPDLITVRGLTCLQQADAVVHDRLVSPDLLKKTSPTARLISVGKAPGTRSISQRRINRLLLSLAWQGKVVARLKGGDSFVFGRGGEECQVLARAGVRFEVIPGVSSALAAPAAAGIPVTHRGLARSFTVVTGHTAGGDPFEQDWQRLAQAETLVILMGLANLRRIAAELLGAGMRASTPAAVVSRAYRRDQVVVRGTLSDIAVRARGLATPATIVVGEVVSLAEIQWFGEDAALSTLEAVSA